MATPKWYCVLLLLQPFCFAYRSGRKIGEHKEEVDIAYYEYGAPIEGHEVSFTYSGSIPGHTPIYHLSVEPKREDLEKKFTYLRVEYVSPLSKVVVTMNPVNNTLSFFIRFPFLTIPIGIVGYSMPLKKKTE